MLFQFVLNLGSFYDFPFSFPPPLWFGVCLSGEGLQERIWLYSFLILENVEAPCECFAC